MRVLGLDCGSRYVKMVILEDGHVTYKHQVSTVSFYKDYCVSGDTLTFKSYLISETPFDAIYTTGYGRNHMAFSGSTAVNELKAHAWGALYKSNHKDFILLDIGGQDVKVIRVEKGLLTDLELNEKCAASCGRYLENMANVLDVPLDEMSSYHENPVHLNATCAVFSESELIGQLARGADMHSLYAGVNHSLYNRLKPMLAAFKGKTLLLSGGVSHNQAIIHYLKADYDEVIVLDDPSFNGALGCAIYGLKQLSKEGIPCSR
ncbi:MULTISPECIES: acyl-CoA dehydratase activase [unclassified Fusibacter]|uniref:acyl-CoA dehydratase activase n=1 Tax=unclassified Fusibacter TaxID=2624464 RepID=UPI001010E224|nr:MULTISPECIES: acyl-CoA dehydratase activase [unclassified Fusibacter]MCK8059779.1 acyl-CoA dehydratase activase [Fusibacter sp. A2]NPE21580.1 2-hydroxyglutaryl-CoA dehydratase [Fusibacter sp. A1]RXV61988.1 2-hydroxyglutaryl-CoA dehydratase [Fusibacter sp. A1]